MCIRDRFVFVTKVTKRPDRLAAFKSYFQPTLGRVFSVRGTTPGLRMLRISFRWLLVLAVLGTGMVGLNLGSESVFDAQDGCTDPFVHATIAPTTADTPYQYIWVVLNMAIVGTVQLLLEIAHRQSLTPQALRVYQSLQVLVGPIRERAVIDTWRQQMAGTPAAASKHNLLSRKVQFYLLHVPVLMVSSLPVMVYVLAQNISADDSPVLSFMANSVAIAVVNLGARQVMAPRVASWLARLKLNVKSDAELSSDWAIVYCKAQVESLLLYDVGVNLVAPMMLVLLLDENCLRFYVGFTTDLHTLFENWGIAQTGSAAYRQKYCSRELVAQFTYVWVSSIVINMFLAPITRMVEPTFDEFKKTMRAKYACEQCQSKLDYRSLLLQRAKATQLELSAMLSDLVTCVVFGVLVPQLLLLAPLAAWLNICSMQWMQEHGPKITFGAQVAQQILVHPPITSFLSIAILGNWVISGFVVFDLNFGVGPIVLYTVISLAGAITARLLRRKSKPARKMLLDVWSKPSTAKGSVVIDLNPVHNHDLCSKPDPAPQQQMTTHGSQGVLNI
eukprot:TRINITY_DN17732_c0_g1_i2.p1 TRINITY_DN17732_c0_g1~~TRINITY_DN17732_c0_g1_i2.p1  ORF type:complete len:559 (-),score=88.77 TRINITY_DN17732_c0_g1_i2:50-1726(-)